MHDLTFDAAASSNSLHQSQFRSSYSLYDGLINTWYGCRYHSLHHTQFRTNYSLFMPIYDYIYGTMDTSSVTLYEDSLKRPEEAPDVVHLTHLTTPDSIYHSRLGLAYLASNPQKSKWYLWLMWPVTLWTMMLTWIYGRAFVVERNRFHKLRLQTWTLPKYNIQVIKKDTSLSLINQGRAV